MPDRGKLLSALRQRLLSRHDTALLKSLEEYAPDGSDKELREALERLTLVPLRDRL